MQRKEVKNKMTNTPIEGWTSEMKGIADSFAIHRKLLYALMLLGDIVPKQCYMILQRDFEQNTWAKIRGGE